MAMVKSIVIRMAMAIMIVIRMMMAIMIVTRIQCNLQRADNSCWSVRSCARVRVRVCLVVVLCLVSASHRLATALGTACAYASPPLHLPNIPSFIIFMVINSILLVDRIVKSSNQGIRAGQTRGTAWANCTASRCVVCVVVGGGIRERATGKGGLRESERRGRGGYERVRDGDKT